MTQDGAPRPVFGYGWAMPASDPTRPETLRRIASKAGFLASALAVFTCGYLAMRSDDWKRMVLYSALALVAGALASAFSRGAR